MINLVRLLKAIRILAGAWMIVFLCVFLTRNFPEYFAVAGLLLTVAWIYWLLGQDGAK